MEALSAGLISTIVAGALLTVLQMTNAQIRDGSGNMRVARLQTVVSDQIRMSTRLAAGVKTALEDTTTTLEHMALVTSTSGPLQEVRLTQVGGDPFARYRLRDLSPRAYLEEWKVGDYGPDYYPFTVGSDTVFVDYATSYFRILPNRRGITFKIQHTSFEDGKSYTFPSTEETGLCRNI